MQRQFLLQMAGTSGAGKSTLAQAIGRRLGAIVLDKDVVKSAALDSGTAWELSGRIGYEVVHALAAGFLRQGFSVILDTPCHFPQTLERAMALASERDVPLAVIECVLPDPAVIQQRLRDRPRLRSQCADPQADPADGTTPSRLDTDRATGVPEGDLPPIPRLQIDCRESPEVCLSRALAYLANLTPGPLKRSVTTYYLEMTDPTELQPARSRPEIEAELEVVRAEIPSPALSRFLYTAVGGPWYWTDRLGWSYSRWQEYLDRPEVETWVGSVHGTPAGYFELERQTGGNVEIVYFGLLPEFIGRGLGGQLLTQAVRRAWAGATQRVWVHTCTLDGPVALQNYLARGFRLYREETHDVVLPPAPPGPWPGADLPERD